MVPRLVRRLLTVILLVVMLLSVLLAGAMATGRVGYVITNGISMNPIYYQGDLVVIAKADSYHVGEIVAYRVPAKHLVILHRIIGGNASGFVMKGDNNQSIDPTHPTASQVVGHAVLHLSHGGLWLKRLTSPAALALIAFFLVAGGGAVVLPRHRRRKRAASRHTATRPSSQKLASLATTPQWLRSAAVGIAVVGIAGAALASLAWTGPATKLATSMVPASLSMRFSYTASVPQTPAYDGTTVTSPDPVFRKLTNTVDVHFAYQGTPGTVAVAAELSNPSGWHSTISLAAPETFRATHYEGSVPLDLTSLDARAQAAAAVTGLPAEPLTVTVVARVNTANGAHFAPTLPLSLSPLQLTLTGGSKALVTQDFTAVQQTTTVSRMIGALGRHITVATARTLSEILLLAALLGAAVLALIARRSAPMSEGAGIRRRYGPLLVRVHPMVIPPDRPVVDVTEFATLARLAEQYGLVVFHWSFNDAETFIVQDQGATYRYRTSAGVASDPINPTTFVDGPQRPMHLRARR
jgi:signal peptidase I